MHRKPVTGLRVSLLCLGAAAGLLAPPAAAQAGDQAQLPAGRPLIQLTASGTWQTQIYNIGCLPCILDTSFVATQIMVFHDGGFYRLTSSNDLDEPTQASGASVVGSRGSLAALEELRQALRTARIGFERGGCRAEVSIFRPPGSTFDEEVLVVDAEISVTWHGQGNRIRSFQLSRDADTVCSPELTEAVSLLLLYPQLPG